MPTYTVTDPTTGKSLKLSGDSPPSEAELNEIFSHVHGDAQPSMLSDVGKSAWGGLMTGLNSLANTPGNLLKTGLHGAGYVANYLNPGTGDTMNRITDAVQSIPGLPFLSSSESNAPLMQATGGNYVPKTTAGQYANTAGEFAPGLAGGWEGALPRLGRVAASALGSETAGQITAGTPYEGAARFAGGLVGGVPDIARAGGRLAGRALTTSLPAEDAGLVTAYEELGGNLRPGQYNPSNLMRQADSVLADAPFNRAAGFKPNDLTKITPDTQADQFNTLLSKTFGENSPRLTGDVLAKAQQRIGNEIETITSSHPLSLDAKASADIKALQAELADSAPALKPDDVTRVGATSNKILSNLADGLTGENYQKMRQRGGLLQSLSDDADPTVAEFGQRLRGILDRTFMRQAPQPEVQRLLKAREQYRSLKTIEPIANASPTGAIPGGAALLGRVVSEYGNPNNAGDLGTLARVGKAYLKPMANSGTSERGLVRELLRHPIKAAAQAISLPVVAGTGRVMNAVVNSPSARQRLLAEALQNAAPVKGGGRNLPSAALLGAILSGGH